MVSDTTSRPPLKAVAAVSPAEDAFAERWRQWQLGNEASSRKGAQQARIAFVIVFAGIALAWLAAMFLTPAV